MRTLALSFCLLFGFFSMGNKSCDKVDDKNAAASLAAKDAKPAALNTDDALAAKPGEKKSAGKVVNPEAFLSCSEDVKCTTIKADCCGCQAGGKQIAIAESSVEQWNAKLSEGCGGKVCAQMISKDPSCKKSAKCNHGQCGLE